MILADAWNSCNMATESLKMSATFILWFFYFFPGKGTISRRSTDRIKRALSLYTPKTRIRAHVWCRGHKQKIVAGVTSANRFNKISLRQKGLLSTTNRVLVWNSPGRRRSFASLLMPLETRLSRALRVRRCATEKGFSGLFSDVTESARALPLSDIPYCMCHGSPIKMSPHRGLSFSGEI